LICGNQESGWYCYVKVRKFFIAYLKVSWYCYVEIRKANWYCYVEIRKVNRYSYVESRKVGVISSFSILSGITDYYCNKHELS